MQHVCILMPCWLLKWLVGWRVCVSVYVGVCVPNLKLIFHLWAELLAEFTWVSNNFWRLRILIDVHVSIQLNLQLTRADVVGGRHHPGNFTVSRHLSDWKQDENKLTKSVLTVMWGCLLATADVKNMLSHRQSNQ